MNTIVVEGNVCAAPEKRVTSNGETMALFSIADNVYKGETNFFKCIAFGKTADFLINFVKSGSLLYVVGSMKTKSGEYKGQKFKNIDVAVDRVGFPNTSKKKDEAFDNQGKNNNDNTGGFTDDDDEEIPF